MDTNVSYPHIYSLSETSMVVQFANTIDPDIHLRILTFIDLLTKKWYLSVVQKKEIGESYPRKGVRLDSYAMLVLSSFLKALLQLKRFLYLEIVRLNYPYQPQIQGLSPLNEGQPHLICLRTNEKRLDILHPFH